MTITHHHCWEYRKEADITLTHSEWAKTLWNSGHSECNKVTVKTCVKHPLSKRPKIGFRDQLSLTAGQKYCRMLQGEHSAILSTFIKLPFVIKIFVLSIFEWPFYTGFTVILSHTMSQKDLKYRQNLANFVFCLYIDLRAGNLTSLHMNNKGTDQPAHLHITDQSLCYSLFGKYNI